MLRTAISGRIVRNSHAHVVNELGKAIVGGTYRSGDLLPGDSDLAERFDVSRTVLREAMKTLSAKGMVTPKARVGTRVTDATRWNLFDSEVLIWHLENGVSERFVGHLSEMRLAFEPVAAELAASKATAQDLEALGNTIEAMKGAASREEFAIADLNFHLAMLTASKNPFMMSVGSLIEAALLTSFRLSSPMGEPEKLKASTAAHQAIFSAIAARDGKKAASGVEKVIGTGRDHILLRIREAAV